MYYENAMKVTMKNENAAAEALEIMKTPQAIVRCSFPFGSPPAACPRFSEDLS